MIENYGQDDCQCGMCQCNRNQPDKKKKIINHGDWKPAHELEENEINRVAISGDEDYEGIAK